MDDTIFTPQVEEYSIDEAVDALSGKYGKHALHLGGSHCIELLGQGRRETPTVREQALLYGEIRRKHLGAPLFPANFPPGNILS
jgi:hypothetical protein